MRAQLLGRTALVLVSTAMVIGMAGSADGAVIASDDFERAADNGLGTTPVGAYTWTETEASAGTISLADIGGNGKARINSRGNGTDPAAVLNVAMVNVDVTVTMQNYYNLSDNYFGGILYRVPVPSAGFASDTNPATAGYVVDVTSGTWGPAPYTSANMIGLRYANNTYLAQVVLPSPITIDTDYELHVVAVGNSHKVFWNGNLVIDYTETIPGRDHAGGVGFGTYYGAWYFDNFVVEGITPPPSHPGDFDGDGDVDGADFVAWQTNFPKASGATLADGDADGDGDVDGADFVVWQTAFPFTPGPSAAPVPEPQGLALLGLGCLLAAIRRVGRRRRSA
ncbi:MAG: hypothetical protein IT427_08680 [Pirellulales bacterium]|nr:hypothetical protein [Pirellulales bacterium]